MPLSETQLKEIRAGIYVASTTPPLPDKATLEKLDDLNTAILDGTWGLWYDFQTIKFIRDLPACEPYKSSVSELLSIVSGVSVDPPPPPPPTTSYPPPVEGSYPIPQGDFTAAVLEVLRTNPVEVPALGIGMAPDMSKVGNYQVFVRGAAAASIYFDADSARQDRQHPGTRKQGTVGVSRDGGIRLGQNAEYSEAGSRIVPDPTRGSNIVGCDSEGDWSFNQDAAGQTHRGQSLVMKCRPEGVYLFLPQAQARLFLEQCANELNVATSIKAVE